MYTAVVGNGIPESIVMSGEDSEVIFKLKKITLASLLFMSVELLGGYFANSIAILADAFHLLSDVLAYIISLGAVLMNSHTAAPHFTFGYEKVQPLGALINVMIIWVVTVSLAWQATSRILHHSVVQEPFYMLLTSLFGLGCNLYIMQILHSDSHHQCSHQHHHSTPNAQKSRTHMLPQHEIAQKQDTLQRVHDQIEEHVHQHSHSAVNLQQEGGETAHIHTHSCSHSHQKKDIKKSKFTNINMEAAYIHILTDIILSIGVIISASIIYLFAPTGWSNWQLADPLCTYFFSVMALYSTYPITKEAIVLLIDGFAHPELVQEIQEELKEKISDNYHRLKLWSTNRTKNYAAIVISKEADKIIVKKIFEQRNIISFVECQQQ